MATINHVSTTPDPILAAIERHTAAIRAYHDAPSLVTNDDLDAAAVALAITPCTSRFGAVALLTHLRGWFDAEAEFSAGHQPAYSVAMARLADLRLFLGTEAHPPMPPLRRALPSGRLSPRLVAGQTRRGSEQADFASIPPDEEMPGSVAPWEAVSAIRPDTAFCRAPRFLDAAGELLAALLIICAGMGLIGLASLA